MKFKFKFRSTHENRSPSETAKRGIMLVEKPVRFPAGLEITGDITLETHCTARGGPV